MDPMDIDNEYSLSDPPEHDISPDKVFDWDGWADLVDAIKQEEFEMINSTPFTEPVWGKVVNKN
jgi:hypothetical protein